MTTEKFSEVIHNQMDICEKMLIIKAKEYATEDRLHNFKCAGGLQNRDPKDALWGMATKHIVSISDMCKSSEIYSMARWDEKITDAINYLLLLKGLVVEESEERMASYPVDKTRLQAEIDLTQAKWNDYLSERNERS